MERRTLEQLRLGERRFGDPELRLQLRHLRQLRLVSRVEETAAFGLRVLHRLLLVLVHELGQLLGHLREVVGIPPLAETPLEVHHAGGGLHGHIFYAAEEGVALLAFGSIGIVPLRFKIIRLSGFAGAVVAGFLESLPFRLFLHCFGGLGLAFAGGEGFPDAFHLLLPVFLLEVLAGWVGRQLHLLTAARNLTSSLASAFSCRAGLRCSGGAGPFGRT